MQARVGRLVTVIVGVLLVAVAVTALVAPAPAVHDLRPAGRHRRDRGVPPRRPAVAPAGVVAPGAAGERGCRGSSPSSAAGSGSWSAPRMRFTYSWDVGVAFRLGAHPADGHAAHREPGGLPLALPQHPPAGQRAPGRLRDLGRHRVGGPDGARQPRRHRRRAHHPADPPAGRPGGRAGARRRRPARRRRARGHLAVGGRALHRPARDAAAHRRRPARAARRPTAGTGSGSCSCSPPRRWPPGPSC